MIGYIVSQIVLISAAAYAEVTPLAIIFVFIAAAAGLSRGTDIFQFFGVGALLGITQGAGAGGAGGLTVLNPVRDVSPQKNGMTAQAVG